jgi:hypothetical protein
MFRKGKSFMNALFILQQITERRRELNFPTFILLIDYERAYVSLNRNTMLHNLSEVSVPKCVIKNTEFIPE